MSTKTIVNGTIQKPDGTLATSGYVEFRLKPASNNVLYRVSGEAIIAPSIVRVNISGTGTISTQLWGNDVISPEGTTYEAAIAPANQVSRTVKNLLITGTTFSLNTPVFNAAANPLADIGVGPSPINNSLIPLVDSGYDIGSEDRKWNDGHFRNLVADALTLRGGGSGASAMSNPDVDNKITFYRVISPLSAPTPALAGLGAGNIDNGNHLYALTYITATGETELGVQSAAVAVADKTVNGQVSLTGLPVSSDSRVTGKYLYRTKIGSAAVFYLLAILNPGDTTYLDNIADAALGIGNAERKDNLTSVRIFDRTYRAAFLGMNNTYVGWSTGITDTMGNNNTAVGSFAFSNNTIGQENVAVGALALWKNTTGSDNVAIGLNTMLNNLSGYMNVAVGEDALQGLLSGYKNVAIGQFSGFNSTTGFQNIFIGNESGYYETGNLTLIIDTVARASEADQRAKALLYGIFANTTAGQSLTVNGKFKSRNAIGVTNDLGGLPIAADNASASAAGVGIGEFYRTNANPSVVCVRTA